MRDRRPSLLVRASFVGVVLAAGLVLGGLGARGLGARADDAPGRPVPSADPTIDPAARLDAFYARYEREVLALRTEVEYLRAREASLSKYVLAFAGASASMRQSLASARTQGFEAAAVPQSSRTTLLAALDQLAGDLAGALPFPTANELAIRRKVDDLRRAADWK